jgi:hypothetical protein
VLSGKRFNKENDRSNLPGRFTTIAIIAEL